MKHIRRGHAETVGRPISLVDLWGRIIARRVFDPKSELASTKFDDEIISSGCLLGTRREVERVLTADALVNTFKTD